MVCVYVVCMFIYNPYDDDRKEADQDHDKMMLKVTRCSCHD